MTYNPRLTRWITAGLLATAVLASASVALADRGGNSRRWKGANNGYNGYPAQRVIVRNHSSSAAPLIAGLIGGFLIGNAYGSNAHPVVVPAVGL